MLECVYNLPLTSVMSPVFSFSACIVDTAGGWLGESTVISSAFVTLALDPFRSIDAIR